MQKEVFSYSHSSLEQARARIIAVKFVTRAKLRLAKLRMHIPCSDETAISMVGHILYPVTSGCDVIHQTLSLSFCVGGAGARDYGHEAIVIIQHSEKLHTE